MQNKYRRNRGFSLIENLFGIFMVAVIASIMAATIPLANRNRASADNSNKAIGIAQKELETIKNVGFPNITATNLATVGLLDSATAAGNGMYPFTNVDNGVVDSPALILPQGRGYVGLTDVATDLRRITVLITWTERNTNKSITVATYVANL